MRVAETFRAKFAEIDGAIVRAFKLNQLTYDAATARAKVTNRREFAGTGKLERFGRRTNFWQVETQT